MTVYGIPNCNTVKKALTWLDSHGFSHEFHDFKKKGIEREKLQEWCNVFGWEKVLNKKGTTWRKLDATVQAGVVDELTAIEVLLKNTSAIRRPVVELDGKAVLIGFEETDYQDKFFIS